MKENRKFLRQCIICRKYAPKEDLIRITKNHKTGERELNYENLIQGRSIYICKNFECCEQLLKNKKKSGLLNARTLENIRDFLHTVLKK